MMSVTGPTDSLQVPQATAASFRGSCRVALFLGAGLVVAACSAPPAPSTHPAPAKAHAAEKPSPHAAAAKKNGNAAATEAALLSNIRQLTFAGRRTGEAYFSADGSRMVFQSEREPDNPFYQIYLMDLATGATRRLSPGHGKTTCAWIHPQGSSAIFASTHHDPEARAKQKKELADRAANKQRRYAWDYDEHYDIFEKDLKTGKLRNLTRTRGYDAEACFSPDGKSIVFASNRQAFAGGLSAEDAATFKHDKSFMIDLYLMNRDGSSVRRLTDVPGYDGGPFFSADGSRICWRRFAKDGATAEIFTMRPDGSDQRQLTRMGAMSWAPFFHPSGQYLIFATNKHGFGNFELYLVDAEGRHDPVRVTQTDGFDGLPVFSPDGETLAWTSTRTPQKQSQVFTATWHHHLALAKLGLAPATSVDLATEAREIARSNLKAGQAWITATDLSRHVHTLASPRFQGRGTGTAGERQATAYVAEVFAQLGLEPAGSEGFFQPFSFTTAGEVGKNNRLASKLAGHDQLPAHLDKDWRPVSFSATGGIPESAVVFAGFGITTESGESEINYDSYVHLDVKDKWVMVLRNVPAKAPGPQKQALRRFAPLQRKAELARERGARGIIFVSGPNSTLPTELVPWRRSGSLGDRPIAAISVSNRLAGAWLKSADRDLKQLHDQLDTGEPAMGFKIPGLRLEAVIDIQKKKRTGRNVLARLRAGTDSGQSVILGGHVDHLGLGGQGSSLARSGEGPQIHYGADDNASGVAAMLEVAQFLAHARKQGRLPLKRDILFAAWSGEEIGLVGSTHFARDLAAKGRDKKTLYPRIAACLNMDMVGRSTGSVTIHGVGSSSDWPRMIEQAAAPLDLTIRINRDSQLPTDSTVFVNRGVPILAAFTGVHSDYHTPADTPEKLNYGKTADITRLINRLTRQLAQADEPPTFVAQKKTARRPRGSLKAYLGTIPDYADTQVKGLRLSGVTPGGPADQAGLEAEDIIVRLGDRDVRNIYDYTDAIGSLKVGTPTTVVIERAGRKLTRQIKPMSRE